MAAADRDEEARRIASSARRDDPTLWFEELYAAAEAGTATIPWDRDGAVNPLLVEWTAEHHLDGNGRTALVVGCGSGADAAHLASLGFRTTAFDVAPTAVALARRRHPDAAVEYLTADLLRPPENWSQAFDFVLESLTVQSLPIPLHGQATDHVRRFVAPGGTLLVLAVARREETVVDGPPWPLTRSEVEAFAGDALVVRHHELLPDPGGQTRRWWRLTLVRPGTDEDLRP